VFAAGDCGVGGGWIAVGKPAGADGGVTFLPEAVLGPVTPGMRRDYFTPSVEAFAGDGARRPVLTIEYDGPAERLDERMTKGTSMLGDSNVDVAYRLKDAGDGAEGVLAVADRVTGEYVLELNAEAGHVFELVEAAREFGQTADTEDRYRIVMESDGDHLVTYDKATLLVYDHQGELLRSRSLIPSGVEL
jgi:hypothetical protein